MVIDAPSEPAPYSKSVSQPVESLRGSKMDHYRDLEFSNSSSTSSHQASGGPQRVGTYIIERTIGKGNFSFVKLARHTVTNVKVAIKIIDKTKLNEENLKKAQREANILKSLHHPNIIKLYQVMESEKLLCIVTEYLPNGELYEYIARNGYLSEQVARHKFMEILSAVEHCHLNNVVHRDLKAENMLLDHHMSIKLADFGFGTFQPSGPDSLLTTWCGSPPYAAPEIFKGEPYLGVSADIWSLGVILYVLVCGVLPFNAQEVSCLRRQVLEEHVRVPYWLSMSCEDLLKRMLAKSPGKRPSIAEIKASKWLSEISDVGPVPFPIAMDEPDTASVHRLSTSLDAGKTGPSIIPHRSRSPVQSIPSPTLAAEMKAGKLDETVIQIMENSGIDRGQLLESLKRCAYDHLTATYLLLGESLRKNRHSLSQTLAPRTEEIEVLCQARKRQSQQQQQVFQHHQYQQPYARSSCPSGGVAVELLFQQHLPNWHHHQLHNRDCNEPSTYFDVKNEPSISLGAPSATPFVCGSVSPNPNAFVCPSSGGNGLTSRGDAPIYPSSHPRQGFLFGPTLPLVVEFSVPGTGVGLRRTDASPSPPVSPINLSSRCTAESSNVGGNCGGDCFEFDWLPYQSEGVASSPAPVFSFGGELTPKQSTQSVFGGPSFPINPLSTGNAPVFPLSAYAPNPFSTHPKTPLAPGANPHETDLTFIPPKSVTVPSTSVLTHPHSDSHNQPSSIHRLTSHQRRYSAIGASSRLLPLPASLIQCPCDSQHLYEKCANDEHTSGLGSSIEADSHHSSFSQPTAAASLASALAHASHFTPMETGGINEDIGIDIPTTARVHRKRISAHSPLIHPASCSATSPAAALAAAAALAMGGCPRRKFGVIERPPALTEQLGRFQFQQMMVGGGAPKQSQPTQQTPTSHLTHHLQQQQPFNSMNF